METIAMPASQARPSLLHRIFDTAFNQGDLAIVEKLLSPGSITHLPAWGLSQNRLGLKQLIAGLRAAIPDLHCTIEDEIHQEEKSAALCKIRGTHAGALFGRPPTGRRIEVLGVIFAHSNNGQILETWILLDQMGMLQQLSLVPPPRVL